MAEYNCFFQKSTLHFKKNQPILQFSYTMSINKQPNILRFFCRQYLETFFEAFIFLLL